METIKAKVHMLPTEDKSHIKLYDESTINKLQYVNHATISIFKLVTNQHLYITTDEEIKEGDWMWHKDLKSVMQSGKDLPKYNQNTFRKIIATTDPELTTKEVIKVGDRVHSNKQDFNDQIVAAESSAKLYNKSDHYFKSLARIPQSFIEEYCKAGGIDEVLVEYEEVIGGICDCPAKDGISARFDSTNRIYHHVECSVLSRITKLKLNPDNTIIIHPVEEKKVFEFELKVLAAKLIQLPFEEKMRITESVEAFDKWIEENL